MLSFTENPAGTEGFAFLEFCTPKLQTLESSFFALGFSKIKSKLDFDLHFYKQNQIDFRINLQSEYAQDFAALHGASVCAMAFQVKDASKAWQRSVDMGAQPVQVKTPYPYPAIYGIGQSLIYFVDDSQPTILDSYSECLVPNSTKGLQFIDHLTHNVQRGRMDTWVEFYQRIFNFQEIRYFDIQGQHTGLYSRALVSPCGNIRIPINESADEKSQIEEFIREFKGEGIQHIAFSSNNIFTSVQQLRAAQIQFLDTPDTYYEMIDNRIPWHQEPLAALKELRILIDGTHDPKKGLLLQIFTQNMLGPVFFEIIQRKGNDGFGEGNFKALFEAIERDQIRRGVI